MKRTVFTLVFALIACLTTFAQKSDTLVWDNPVIGFTRCATIGDSYMFPKVEFSKNGTSLYIVSEVASDSLFSFSQNTYIGANGKRYNMIDSERTEVDIYIADIPTKRKGLMLRFPPLPQNIKSFDLLEGLGKDDKTFFAVHPLDVKLPEAKVPKDFVVKNTKNVVLPKMKFSEEPAKIHYKALNYKKGMNAEVYVGYFDFKNATYRTDQVFFDDNGCAEFSVKNYLPTWAESSMTFRPYRPDQSSFSATYTYLVPGKEITLLIDMTKSATADNGNFVGRKGYLANAGIGLSVFDGLMVEEPEFPYDEFYKAKTVQQITELHDTYMQRVREWFASRKAEGGHPEDLRKNASSKEIGFFEMVAEYHPVIFTSKEFRDYIFTSRPECFWGDSYDFDGDEIYSLFAGTDVEGLGPDIYRYLYGVNETQYGHFVEKPVIHNPNLSRLYDEVTSEVKAKVQELRSNKPSNIHFLDEVADIPPTEFLQTIVDRYKGKTILFRLGLGHNLANSGGMEISDLAKDPKYKDVVFVTLVAPTSSLEEWLKQVKNLSGEYYIISPLQNGGIFYELGERVHGYPEFAVYNQDGKRTFSKHGWKDIIEIKTALNEAMK